MQHQLEGAAHEGYLLGRVLLLVGLLNLFHGFRLAFKRENQHSMESIVLQLHYDFAIVAISIMISEFISEAFLLLYVYLVEIPLKALMRLEIPLFD